MKTGSFLKLAVSCRRREFRKHKSSGRYFEMLLHVLFSSYDSLLCKLSR